jgi:hypothetical protein
MKWIDEVPAEMRTTVSISVGVSKGQNHHFRYLDIFEAGGTEYWLVATPPS